MMFNLFIILISNALTLSKDKSILFSRIIQTVWFFSATIAISNLFTTCLATHVILFHVIIFIHIYIKQLCRTVNLFIAFIPKNFFEVIFNTLTNVTSYYKTPGILFVIHFILTICVVLVNPNPFNITLLAVYIGSILGLCYVLFINTQLSKSNPYIYLFLTLAFSLVVVIGFIYFAIAIIKLICFLYKVYSEFVYVKANKPSSSNNTGESSNGNRGNKPPKGNDNTPITPEEKKKRKLEAQARYREKHREELRQKNIERYAADPEKEKQRIKKARQKKPELYQGHTNKASKKWAENNREKSRENSKHWREKNPDKVKANNDLHGSIKKEITQEGKKDMAQYEGTDRNNYELFEQWSKLSLEDLKEVFRQKRIRKSLQQGFEFYKANPNYYDDLDMEE